MSMNNFQILNKYKLFFQQRTFKYAVNYAIRMFLCTFLYQQLLSSDVMRTTENLPKDWWFFFIHTSRTAYSVNNPPWYFVSVATCSTAPLHVARHAHPAIIYNIILDPPQLPKLLWRRRNGPILHDAARHWSRLRRARVLWMKPARFFIYEPCTPHSAIIIMI